MTTCDEWAQALLTHGEWPVTMEHRMGLVAWAMAEGTITVPACSGALWNPLDTTEPAPGATDFNAVGVKNYPDEPTGIEAVYATLLNGRYPPILAWLADEGSSALGLPAAVAASPWGTGNFSKAAEMVKASPDTYFAVEVPGSSPAPAPEPSPPVPVPPQEVAVQVPVLSVHNPGPTVVSEPVRNLQRLLTAHGFGVGPAGTDGRFGNDTASAVVACEHHYGLSVDAGIAGEQVWTALCNR